MPMASGYAEQPCKPLLVHQQGFNTPCSAGRGEAAAAGPRGTPKAGAAAGAWSRGHTSAGDCSVVAAAGDP